MLGANTRDLVVTILWFVAIGGMTWWTIKQQRNHLEDDVGDAIDELEQRTGRTPPPEVRDWLYPLLERRLLWEAGGPAVALGVGWTVLAFIPGDNINTWAFLGILMATFVGMLAAALGTALTQPRLEWNGRRVATVHRRETRDFIDSKEAGALSAAAALAVATIAAGLLLVTRPLDHAGFVIGAGTCVLVLVAGAAEARRLLVRRHMPARHDEDLEWQAEALRYLVAGIGTRTFRLSWVAAAACCLFVINNTSDVGCLVVAWTLMGCTAVGVALLHLAHRAGRAGDKKAAVATR